MIDIDRLPTLDEIAEVTLADFKDRAECVEEGVHFTWTTDDDGEYCATCGESD